MTDVWSYSKASGTDLLVLLALADNANDEGECWLSIGYIALNCPIDTRTTQRRIRSLEGINEVVVIRGGGPRVRLAGHGRIATGSSSTFLRKRGVANCQGCHG